MDTPDEQPASVEQLVRVIRLLADETECWKRAENVLRASTVRDRLEALAIDVSPEIATTLMAVALSLAASSDEWGGDYRDALADLAAVGLELFEG